MSNLRVPTFCVLLLAGAMVSLSAQSPVTTMPAIPVPQIHPGLGGTNRTVHPTTTKPHEEPCWQLAGISKATMDQRNHIIQSTKAQIDAVCANSALSAQQRSLELRQIFQLRQRELEGTITPLQAQEMKTCNQERAATRPPVLASAGPRRGPCGEILPTPNPPPPSKPQQGTSPPSGTVPQD